jgi:hypothetical protein
MPRRRVQIVVLAVTLLFANAWCVAQCAVTPTPANVAPCHRHHQSVKSCASSVMVETANAISQSPPGVVAMGPALEFHPAAPAQMTDPPRQDLSPPPPLFSTPIRA